MEPGEVARTCDGWRHDASLRADWHTYHLIGDVLRSDDLAHAPARDEALLGALRARLAREPVVLAPQPAPVRARRRKWLAPVAVAAGFCAVAGVLVVTRMAPPAGDPAGGMQLAGGGLSARPVVEASSLVPVQAAPQSQLPADPRLIRDARLDRYLAAHKQYGNGSLLPPPGTVVRSANRSAPER